MHSKPLPIHPSLLHPLTGKPLKAVWVRPDGRPVWPVMGGSQAFPEPPAAPPVAPPAPPAPPVAPPPPAPVPPAPPAPAPAPPAPPVAPPAAPPVAPPAPPADNGFPANTPLEQMTPVQQAAYWKHYSRHHESIAKSRADYDTLKAKADAYDQYRASTATEQEKAVQAAADAARAKVLEETTPVLVKTEFRLATAGRLTPEQLDTILGPLDLRWFMDASGNAVDSVKVATYAASIAPAPAGPGGPTPPVFPDLGQGRRAGATGPSVAAGKDLYESQKKARPPAPGTPPVA